MLNETQLKVVNSIPDQNILIIACAGSGKTTTLISRIRYMLNDCNIKPESILLSTFTVEATHNMKKKLIQECGTTANNILIGTLDSLSLRLLLKNAEDMIGNGYNKIFDVSEYGPMFLKFLINHPNRMKVLNEIKYLIIDEYQDISSIQFQIFMKFYENGTFITAVGDDAQNIYSFRGSDVSYILNFDKTFLPCQVFQLVTNYRSNEQIVQFANYSIKQNKNQIEKDMIADKKGGKKPHIMYCNDFNHLKQMILKLITQFPNKKEIAILSRFKKILYDVEVFLNDNSIDCVILDGNKTAKTGVVLCTIHKSKGLEWDNCILLGTHDDIFPKNKKETEVEEERRLFYVACTRAKKSLYCLFNKINFSDTNKYAVSRFITEIPETYYTHNLIKKNMPILNSDKEIIINQSLNVCNLVKKIKGEDYVLLREEKIIPDLYFKKVKLHDKTEHSDFIIENSLEINIGNMVDLMISRMFFSKYKHGKPFAKKARQLVSTVLLTSAENEIYNTYILKNKYNPIELTALIAIKEIEIQIQPILRKIFKSAEEYSIDSSSINVSIAENMISDKFKLKILNHIDEYENLENSWESLIECCFWLSQCEEIMSGKKTIIYNEEKITSSVLNHYLPMFNHIWNSYIPKFNFGKTEIHSVWRNSNGIYGEIDVLQESSLFEEENEIKKFILIDWKMSKFNNMQMSWVMQLLCYFYLGRINKKNITQIGIYNPLKGNLLYVNIGWWKEGEKLFDFFNQKLI